MKGSSRELDCLNSFKTATQAVHRAEAAVLMREKPVVSWTGGRGPELFINTVALARWDAVRGNLNCLNSFKTATEAVHHAEAGGANENSISREPFVPGANYSPGVDMSGKRSLSRGYELR